VTNDATADSGYKFATSGSLWTPRYTTLLSAMSKRWQELFARSLNLSATKYIYVHHSTNDGLSLQNLLSNGDFEVGDPPTGSTAYHSTPAQEGTTIKTGSYSVKITCNGTEAEIYQAIGNYAYYKGRKVTFGAWVLADSGNDKNQVLAILDGVGAATFSSIIPKDDTWHWVTVTRTIDASADKLELGLIANNSAVSDTDDILYADGAILVEGDECPEPQFLNTSPEQTLTLPSVESTMLNLQLDFYSDSETTVPVLKYPTLKALTLVPSVVRFRHAVKCATNLRLKDNMISNTPQSEIMAFIDTIRDKVCTLGDRWGNEHTVRVRVTDEWESFDEDTQQPETVVEIEAMRVV